jgi:hypothetical protein
MFGEKLECATNFECPRVRRPPPVYPFFLATSHPWNMNLRARFLLLGHQRHLPEKSVVLTENLHLSCQFTAHPCQTPVYACTIVTVSSRLVVLTDD